VSKLAKIFAFGAFAVCGLGTASASLVFEGTALAGGAGIGVSNVVLTIQNKNAEQGCIGWNGTADVIGSAACPAGLTPSIVGGDEKTGNSQTGTVLVSATTLTQISQLRVVLNVNEPAGNLFSVENVSLSIYSPTGTILWNSGNLGIRPITIDASFQGQGNLGFAFKLDSVQAAAAQSFFVGTNRLGLAASISNVAGSNEVWSFVNSANITIEAPEPATTFGVSAGLLGLLAAMRFRSGRAKQGIQ